MPEGYGRQGGYIFQLMGKILIENGTIINEGRSYNGYIIIEGDTIAQMGEGAYCGDHSGERLDAGGLIVMPGVIDDQVHFREPGLTWKGDIASESAAAVAGGITSFMEMPNTKPPATSLSELERKYDRAAETSLANYSFLLGATNDNIREITKIDPRHIPGVKVFMGSSTGNMLVDDEKSLSAIFAESPVPIATHCEDESIIRANAEEFRRRYGEGIAPAMHPLIRSAEACYRSSAHAVELADKYGSDLHVLHLSTARELSLFDAKALADKKITNEVCVHHLWFSDEDYADKGNFIKWNPAVKSAADRAALREALLSGKADVVATDHAPHTLEEKERPYWDCPSGGPLVQHSLAAMLELSRRGVLPVEKVVEKMCHAPAQRFRIEKRGYLRPGYFADITIVDPNALWAVSESEILYKCGWSPFAGTQFSHRVVHTFVNGRHAYDNGRLDRDLRGAPLKFER